MQTRILLGFVLGVLCTVPASAGAAYLYFDPGETQIYRGDTVTMAVRIDTDESEGECINVVDATITYSDNVRAVDVSRGDSILSVWVEEPVIDETNHTITFAGGIPGGYCGRIDGDPRLTNIVAEVVFRSPGFVVGGSDNRLAEIAFADTTQVLLHDGLGTPAQLTLGSASINLSDSAGTSLEDTWNDRVSDDNEAPGEFNIILSQEESAFSGEYFIVFNTSDKQSGLSHYEVMEEPLEEFNLFKWGGVDAPWVRTTSPYVLVDQSLNSTIRVKAVDKAGNETISQLIPDKAVRTMSQQRSLLIVLLLTIAGLIILGIGFALWRRKRELDTYYDEVETDSDIVIASETEADDENNEEDYDATK